MLAEAAESVRLIGDLLDAGAGAGTADLASDRRQPSGLGWAESSARRGAGVGGAGRRTAGSPGPGCARPRSRNWRGFDDACRSQNVFTDIPIIEASFWLTVAGTAR